MRDLIRRLLGKSAAGDARSETLELELQLDHGFHADRHVLALADFFLRRATVFIETGTLAGSTALYVGRSYPIRVHSCESDRTAWKFATRRCREQVNIHIENAPSPQFLYRLFEREPQLAGERIAFWLDAHGYGFPWPLLDELRFITRTLASAVIMIDDFKVPGRPEFGFDAYDGQECSLEFVLPALDPSRDYAWILPTYRERTSPFHGLRGVGTLVYGLPGLELPASIRASFELASVVPSRPSPQNRNDPSS